MSSACPPWDDRQRLPRCPLRCRGGDSPARLRTCSSYKLPLKWKTPPICHCEAPTGPWQSRAGTCSPYKPPSKWQTPPTCHCEAPTGPWQSRAGTYSPYKLPSKWQTPPTCHCEEAAGRRGALSAQREEVPLGCNLGKAVTFSPIAFPRCSRVLRDSHVASLLGMTNLGACQNFCDFLQTRKLILDFFSIYVTI